MGRGSAFDFLTFRCFDFGLGQAFALTCSKKLRREDSDLLSGDILSVFVLPRQILRLFVLTLT
jgi:hypothetical protein